MKRLYQNPVFRIRHFLLPRIMILVVLFVLTLCATAGTALAAEPRYLDDNSEAALYLEVYLPNGIRATHQEHNILRWKDFEVTAVFLDSSDGSVPVKIHPDNLSWESSDESAARYTGNGQIHTFKASDTPVTLTATYTNSGKTHVATLTLNIKKLKVAADKEILRYAALSQLAYTDLDTNIHSGKTVEELLTPVSSGGVGVQMDQGDVSILASCSFIETTANFRDFVVAGANDCTFIMHSTDGSFSGSVFRYGGKTIIAYRGTGDLGDLLTDIQLGLGFVENRQFSAALKLCKNMISTWGESNVVVTGHSLGGGLANYVSLLTGVKAYTFNAPSTMVTAVSNFQTDLIQNYFGLDDGLRIDYVNHYDWVGKVGAGDSKDHLWTGDENEIISGNLDQTEFHARALRNRNPYGDPLTPNHAITRMVNYDPAKEEISITPVIPPTTHPKQCSIYGRNTLYWFGSKAEDRPTDIITLPDGGTCGYVFAGNGSDMLVLSSTGHAHPRWVVIGGYGDDVITVQNRSDDEYHYYIGHGTDTITDSSGYDRLYIYGNADIDYSEQSDGTIHVIDKNNSNFIIAKLNIDGSIGFFRIIYKEDKKETTIKTFDRSARLLRTQEYKCPVNVEILDSNGQVIATAYDGAPSSGSGEYGSFSVYASGDSYAKTVTLLDDAYSVRVVGIGEGTMSCRLSYETADGTNEWRLAEIPVHVGSLYYPSGEYSSALIIQCDLDGDGIIDYSPLYTKAESLSMPATAQLAYGETMTLTPSVQPASATPDLVWSSDHPEIVSVNENGVLEATGFGEAVITCYAADGSGVFASTTVTVAEEMLSASEFVITGVQARYDYTGHAVDPEIAVTFRGKTLEKDVHYRVDYLNDLLPGTASVIVDGIVPFTGSVTLDYEIYLYQPSTVEEKVEYLAEQCIASGVQGEYAIALWMHDWLTANANYDYTYTEYFPEGVLLKGTGVCQSYALAFELLLNRMGIENMVISSQQMDHAWNLVKLDGEWCHIDCTWDDPGMGGNENHNYFGMNDALISRDHVWPVGMYPVSTALTNYYPVRMGLNCVDSQASMEMFLSAIVADKVEEFEFCYIGSDPSFDLWDAFQTWYATNNWRYGLHSYFIEGTEYRMVVSITYTDPWEQPVNRLDPPVAAPDFSINTLNGRISLSNYRHNSMVLVFGREECANTVSLLQRLSSETQTLKNGGIEAIVCLDGVTNLADLMDISSRYPGLNFAGDQTELMYQCLQSINYAGGTLTYPLVLVVNSDPAITYYSTGYVWNLDTLMGEAFATATNNPLPLPGENDYSQGIPGTGSIANLTGEVPNALRSLCANGNQLIFITDYAVYYDALELMAEFEENYSLNSRFGIQMAASFMTYSTGELEQLKAEYPHVTFLDYGDGAFFWDMLHTAGFDGIQAYYRCAYQLGRNGDILSYTNGSLINPTMALIEFLDGMHCDTVIPNALTDIQAEAFAGMKLNTVNLNDTYIYSIGSRAFADCDEMALILIPKSVRSIASDAFEGCQNLIIFCPVGSYAHQYALEHQIPYLVK